MTLAALFHFNVYAFKTNRLSSTARNSLCCQHTQGYVNVKQGKLFYQKFGKGKLPIIVLHGDPRLGHSYLLPQMIALAKDREVIFYDQRGSGKSQYTQINSNFINMKQFVEDLDDLRKQLGLKKIILLGHSLGGSLALSYSIKHPKRVSALILLNSTPISNNGKKAFEEEFKKRTLLIRKESTLLDNPEEFRRLTPSQRYNLYQTILPVLFYNSSNAKKLTLKLTEISAKNGDKASRMMSDDLMRTNHLVSQLEHLKIPLLIIHGYHDLIPFWTVRELKKFIPDAHIIVFTRSGHFPYIEQPKQLFAAIQRFLYRTHQKNE